MTNNILMAATVLLVIIAVYCIGYIVHIAKKYNVDVADLTEKANAEVPLLTQIINVLAVMLPAPFNAAAALIGGIIIKCITRAEELMTAGTITADQRKTEAMGMISGALKVEGITPTDKALSVIGNIVDIAAAVLLPHGTAVSATPSADTPATPAATQTPAATIGAAQ